MPCVRCTAGAARKRPPSSPPGAARTWCTWIRERKREENVSLIEKFLYMKSESALGLFLLLLDAVARLDHPRLAGRLGEARVQLGAHDLAHLAGVSELENKLFPLKKLSAEAQNSAVPTFTP